MSFPAVLERGDDFLGQYPRTEPYWNPMSKFTCYLAVGFSKLVLNTCYNPKLHGYHNLEKALERTKTENRGLMTVMNHMSVVDDPFLWGVFPWKMYQDLDLIRWCLGAHNVCFTNSFTSTFFSLGKILATERFGGGPFQGSIDASIRLLSPDDTLDLEWTPHSVAPKKTDVSDINTLAVKTQEYVSPISRTKPSWVHVYPEGFVMQLYPPFNNSMRYFRWGITRLILESTVMPIVVPIFSTGFEKIAPESAARGVIERYLPRNFGAEINVNVGEPIDDKILGKYREEWAALCEKYADKENPKDLSYELKYGKDAQDLRSRLAAELRSAVADIRHSVGFAQEDPRFQSPEWWKTFTGTEGASDPDIQFIGENWAIRRLQKFLNEDSDLE